MVALVRATREHTRSALGASPRATLALFHAAQALAAMRGRDLRAPGRREGAGGTGPGPPTAADQPGAAARALRADRAGRSRRLDARSGRVIQHHGDSAGSTLWLVTARGVLSASLLLSVAVWNQSAPLAAMAGLLLALARVTRIWSRLALHSVRCTLEFQDDRASRTTRST